MTRAARLTVGLPPFLALKLACLLAYAAEVSLDLLFPRVERAMGRLAAWIEGPPPSAQPLPFDHPALPQAAE